MDALGIAGCEESKTELVERVYFALTQKRLVKQLGRVRRSTALRWINRALDKAKRADAPDVSRPLDRNRFHARRQYCLKCVNWKQGEPERHTRDGCALLDRPCSVEFRWMADRSDWCPAGKDVNVEMHDHQYFNSDPSSFLKIELPPDELPEQKHDLAIVTHAAGANYERCREISRPSISSYADRIGADLVELSGDVFPAWKLANKFRAAAVAKRYKRTLWLDVDVIVSDNAPSIFDEIPADHWAIFDEMLCSATQSTPGWERHQTRLVCESQGMPPVDLKWSGNGGVLLIPQRWAHCYEPPAKPTPTHWCAEQQLLTARLQAENVPVHLLDWKWNCLRTGRYWQRRREAWFTHFNGVFGWQLVSEMDAYVAGQL